MSSRYEATSHTDTNGDTTVTVIDLQGDNHRVSTHTKADGDAFVAGLSEFVAAGVARYGSLDNFQRALMWFNDQRGTEAA